MPEQGGEKFRLREFLTVLAVENGDQVILADHAIQINRRHGVGMDQVVAFLACQETGGSQFLDRLHAHPSVQRKIDDSHAERPEDILGRVECLPSPCAAVLVG